MSAIWLHVAVDVALGLGGFVLPTGVVMLSFAIVRRRWF